MVGHSLGVPWHRRSPTNVPELRKELSRKYPDLCLLVEGDSVALKGCFPIVHEGVECGRFCVEVVIPSRFPDDIPSVREKAGRIPVKPEWHAYMDGNLCIIVPEEWLINPSSGSVISFLDGPVRNYFISHLLAEVGHKRPMGERSHGSKGLLEAYCEMLGVQDFQLVERYIALLAKKHVKAHWPCPCGSRNQLRNCHSKELRRLGDRIPRRIARSALDRLEREKYRERLISNLNRRF